MAAISVTYPSIALYNDQTDSEFMKKENCEWSIYEKVDGSQLSVQRIGVELIFSNKNKTIHSSTSNQCFELAVKELSKIAHSFNSDYIYSFESICSTSPNKIHYQRTPRRYAICFDIWDLKMSRYLDNQEVALECERIGLEFIKPIYQNSDETIAPSQISAVLMKKIESNSMESCLGGQMEGIVIKHNHAKIAEKIVSFKKKIVRKSFQERSHIDLKQKYHGAKLFLDAIGKQFAKQPRYHKAIQHLKERQIEVTIENYIKELDEDFVKEYVEEIRTYLFDFFSPAIRSVYCSEGVKWMNKLPIQFEQFEQHKQPIRADCSSNETIVSRISVIANSFVKEEDYLVAYSELKEDGKIRFDSNDNEKMNQFLKNKFASYSAKLQTILWESFGEFIMESGRFDCENFFI